MDVIAGGPRVIAVGASAGGVEALSRLAATLPDDFPAALAVVLHVPASAASVLADILARAGPLASVTARDGQALEAGRIYVAPSDCHLLVEGGAVRLDRGPKENGHRPAVDPLFASVARAYGSRAIGVVLTGTLDDGVAGLAAIKLAGGIAVVQDPNDALYPGMPASAIERVAVDHVVRLDDLAGTLMRIVGPPERDREPEPEPIMIEPNASHDPGPELSASPAMRAGDAVGLSCPECGGSLWYVGESPGERFTCRVGHAYSEHSLFVEQGRSLEAAMWTALRALEERAAVLRRMARRARDAGNQRSAERFSSDAQDFDRHASTVREHVIPAARPVDIDIASRA